MNDNFESFFPQENYEVPVTSNYMKFANGDNPFRVLSSAITGYEYFTKDNKPVRSKEEFTSTPDMKAGGAVKHFWAFVVYNYNAKRIQILELTQKSVMLPISSYIKNPNWGHPTQYDFIVNKVGTNMNDTEYTITVNPKKEIDASILEQYKNMNIDLSLLYEGQDPFAPTK